MTAADRPGRVFRWRNRWHAFCRICHRCVSCDNYWKPELIDDAYNHLSEEHKDKMAAGGV